MIPGNPGLISYYTPFLETLRSLLDEKEAKEDCRYAFYICGTNLLGFDDADHVPAFGTRAAGGVKTEPFELEDQIRWCCERVQETDKAALGNGKVFDDVVLIGHSVGAYIALEVFNRHHQARRGDAGNPLGEVKLKAGILLFPTVSHIAKSSSGKKLDWIRRTPVLDSSVHHFAKGLVSVCPRWLLAAAVRRLLGFPEHAAAATMHFLCSRDGIWQALHLGKDEMRTITEEKWTEDLWEIEDAEDGSSTVSATKFFFHFARQDHWVADECRDEFIEKRRGHVKGRTRIVIDEDKIPHAFCISKQPSRFGVSVGPWLPSIVRANLEADHSELMAEKVKRFVEDSADL
jgi:pimeloyl-ACP methyl ester carboxylesterase